MDHWCSNDSHDSWWWIPLGFDSTPLLVEIFKSEFNECFIIFIMGTVAYLQMYIINEGGLYSYSNFQFKNIIQVILHNFRPALNHGFILDGLRYHIFKKSARSANFEISIMRFPCKSTPTYDTEWKIIRDFIPVFCSPGWTYNAILTYINAIY